MSTNPPNDPWSYPPPPAPPPPPPGGGYLAGWWLRVGATILDGIILSIPIFIVSYSATRAAGLVAATLIEGAYFTIMLSRRGQTVGNMAVSTRVVDAATGGPISTGKALGRWAAQFLFGLGVFVFLIPTLLDYLWPLWDSRNQTLHDKMVGTVVIRG